MEGSRTLPLHSVPPSLSVASSPPRHIRAWYLPSTCTRYTMNLGDHSSTRPSGLCLIRVAPAPVLTRLAVPRYDRLRICIPPPERWPSGNHSAHPPNLPAMFLNATVSVGRVLHPSHTPFTSHRQQLGVVWPRLEAQRQKQAPRRLISM